MTPGAEAILNDALSLTAEDRVALAEKLLESLEGKDQNEVDMAWAAEAERRIQAYQQGTLKAIPGDEVRRALLPKEC